MSRFPVPLVALLNGITPIVNEVFSVVAVAVTVDAAVLELTALMSGPRMPTCLLSIGSALAAISGVTVTVLAVRLTTFEAARLKFRASWDAPLEATLKRLLGSRFTVI